MRKLKSKYLGITAAMGMLIYGTYAADDIFNQSILVEFNGIDEPTIESSGSDAKIKLENDCVTITPQTGGVEVILAGSSSSGGVEVGGDYPVKFVLNGLDLCSTNSVTVCSTSTNVCYVVLSKGTENTLADSLENSGKGILMSKGAMEISGLGTLKLVGASAKQAICSTKGGVTIREGEIIVENAGGDAVYAETDFRINNGTLSIQNPVGDGVMCRGNMTIHGGTILYNNVTENTCGLKCSGNIEFNGGLLSMSIPTSQSKGIYCTDLTVNGGTMLLDLSGGACLVLKTNAPTEAITNEFTSIESSCCEAIKCSGNVMVNRGKITVNHSGVAGKAITANGDITVNDGVLDLFVSGISSSTFKNSAGETDIDSAVCLKSKGNINLLGGKIKAMATGNGGDAVTASKEINMGVEGGNPDSPEVTAVTLGEGVYVTGVGEDADYDNPKAFKASGNLNIYGGRYKIHTLHNGGEGLESKAALSIRGGTIEIETFDDCINAKTGVVITGGTIYARSVGNDGIDSNGTLEISGGLILTSGMEFTQEGCDCDENLFKITGGILVGTGGESSIPTEEECTQRSVIYTGSGMENTVFQITDESGKNVLVYKLPRTYSVEEGILTMLVSFPELSGGVTYSIITGGTITGGTEFHGYYTGATVSGGITVASFIPTSMVTKVTGK